MGTAATAATRSLTANGTSTAASAEVVGRLQGRRWDGPAEHTFVVLHGLGVGSRLVAPLATQLRRHGTVVAPDLPGVGASVHLADRPEQLSVAAHAAVIRRWLQERDLRAVTLLGVSVGTQVATRVAADDDGRIDRLVLLSPTVDPARRRVTDQLVRVAMEQTINSLRFHRVAMQDQAGAGPRRLWWQLRAALDDRPERHLPRVTVPTLVLRGTLDPLVGRAWATQVAQHAPLGTFQELRGVRHAMSFEDVDDVTPWIVGHLTREGPRR